MQTQVHELKCEAVSETFEISVTRCALDDQAPTDVLLVTDPVLQYGATVDIAGALLLSGRLKPLLVVGVGYVGAGTIREALPKRQRDLTPSPVDGREGSGRAAAFLAFLHDELSPWLTQTYGCGLDGAAYAGGSLGGLFGAWSLFQDQRIFDRYLLSSPSLWWDRGLIFDVEATYAAGHEGLDARVYVGVGGDECPGAQAEVIRRLPESERAKQRKEAAADSVDMVAGARLFADALADRAYPDLQLEFEVHPGEDHFTAGFVSMSRGLRYLFQPRP